MTTKSLKFAAAMSTMACSLALTLPVTAAAGDKPGQAGSSAYSGKKHTKKAGDIIGKQVRAEDGTNVGSISDLVIDSQSGKITHGVVRSGGVLGVGGTAKAVSFDAFEHTPGQEGMTISSSGWQEAMDFREDNLAQLQSEVGSAFARMESGARATADRAERAMDAERRAATGTTGSPGLAGTTGTAGTAGMSGETGTGERAMEDTQNAAMSTSLVLASKLDGLDIRGTDGQEIGEVEDVIVQADERQAALLVDLEDDTVDTEHSYVVSFNRVDLSGSLNNRLLTTQLTASDFQKATSNASGDLDSNEPYVWMEETRAAAE